MRACIPFDHEPGLASGAVIPELVMRSRRIVAHIDVGRVSFERIDRFLLRACRSSIAQIAELAEVPGAAVGAGDSHGRSMQIWLRTRAALVEHISSRESIEAKSGSRRVRFVTRD